MSNTFITDTIIGPAATAISRRVLGDVPPVPTPSAKSGRPEPAPFVQEDLFPVRRVDDVSQESIQNYGVQYGEDNRGPLGQSYAVRQAGPLDLTVRPFVRGTDRPEDVPGGKMKFELSANYASNLLRETFGLGQYRYNELTGRVERDDVRTLSMVMPPAIGAFMGFGQAINRRNLMRIGRMADAQEEGYGLGMLGNQVIGVSPAPIGSGYVLSGVLPQGLDHRQMQTIAEQLLGISEQSRSQFRREQAERQRRISQSQANQVEIESGAGLFQPGDRPAQPDSRFTTATETSYATDPGDSPSSFSSDNYGSSYSSTDYSFEDVRGRAKGGPVQRTGFVEGSPDNYTKSETVADTVNTQVRENSFVLNAPTVETLQRAGMLPTGVDKSNKNTTIKANKGGLMPVALSKGEYVIEPEEAQRIGYSFLEKINDQGKAEVDRRQAAADGGFINGYQAGGKTLPTVLPQPSPVRQAYVGEDIDRPEIPLTDNMIAQFKVYNSSKKQRKDVENLINALDDRENLALVALAETTAETDDIEAMMGVQTTVINRVKSKAVKPEKYPLVRRDFKNVTDVKSALKQRTPGRGSGSFMFQYDGFEPKYLNPKIDSVLKGQVPAFAITKIMASSANVLDPEAQFGEGLFPDTVTFYTREDAPLAKDMELNPQMRYVTTLGGHDFYSYEAAPESPDEEKIYKEYLAEKRKKKKN